MFRFASLLVVATVFLAGCSVRSAIPFHQNASPSAAQAASIEMFNQEVTAQGRILMIKDSGIWQFSQGGLKQLAAAEIYQTPAFSPDGRRVAASILGENHSDLVLLDEAGRKLLQLTDNWSMSRVQDSAWATHPTWSPDGRRLAFAGDSLGADIALWVIDAGGTNKRQLTRSPWTGGLEGPSWSPSGHDIVVTAFPENVAQVSLVNVSTGTLHVLTRQAEGAYDGTWSPDSKSIAYAARSGGRTDIWVMGADGSGATRITNLGTARSPVWSPDGSMIAFVAAQNGSFDLYVTKVDSGAPSEAPAPRPLTTSQHFEAPSGLSWAR